MAQPDIDGALVGGASLDGDSSRRIVRYREVLPRSSEAGPGVSAGLRAPLMEPSREGMPPVKIVFRVLLVLTSLLLVLLILLHKGKGGGLSDMFGGGVSSSLGGSSIAERNLDRITIALGLVWFA